MTSPRGEADDVLAFWFGEEPERDEPTFRANLLRWFQGGATMDHEIRARFAELHARAMRRERHEWAATPRGRLALILVLDQFSRNLHRDTARAFEGDAMACALVEEGLSRGENLGLAHVERIFFSLPFGHAEDLATQERSVALVEQLSREGRPEHAALWQLNARQARSHRDTIARFGRFPQRNVALGRTTTDAEVAFLNELASRGPPKLLGTFLDARRRDLVKCDACTSSSTRASCAA